MAAAPTADSALVRRLRERDRTAWDEVYAVYAPRLRAFAYRLAGNSHDADDLVQETFVRALPRLDRLDPATVELGPYLFTTLRNTFLKRVERERRVAPVEEVPEPDVPAPIELDPERRTLLGDQQVEVQLANARLAPRQRLVLALRELEDRSYAEIGEIVGLKENAVAQLISRARESLRTELRLAQVDPARLPDECRAFLPALSRHLDGQLRGAALERMLAHLDSCVRCQDALASMREASRRYRAFIPPLASDDAHAQSIDAELTAARYWERRPGRALRLASRAGALAGVLALAILLGAAGVGAARLVSDGDRPARTTAFRPPATPAPTVNGEPHRLKPVTIVRRSTPRRKAAPPAKKAAPAVRPKQKTTPEATVERVRPAAEPRAVAAPPPPRARPERAAPVVTTTASVPVDRVAPTTSITARPSDPTPAPEAAFAFAASERGAFFECRLDGDGYEPCSSPVSYSGLAPGAHVFAVRARDEAGNTGAPAEARWTVFVPDTTPPATSIVSASASGGDASFSFSSSEDGSAFQCALDGGAYEACASPRSYSGLGYGPHAFAVRATDPAGNTGPAATHEWAIAQPLPNLVVAQLTETGFTVSNVGTAPAGPFVVSVTLIGTFSFSGLAPGQSATRVWSACRIGTLTAVADRGRTVAEWDEDDNVRSLVSDC